VIGEQIGAWRIAAVLGEGTQGTVYAARHTTLPRDAAIKVLLPRLAREPERVERFLDEARAASSIRHPGVVEIYDCGRDPAGRTYIAMERLHGETLHARLRRTVPTLGETIEIVRQLAEALATAHAAGIVHRDLKPENIFLAEEAGEVRVKILDFGIARCAPELRGAKTLSGAGLFGTPPYMSPEQCDGSATIDHRTDLYAIGCLLHELATGTPPFGFEGVTELVEAHRRKVAPSLKEGCPDAPDALDALAARLLAKDPADRPASCRELLDALDAIGLATPLAPAPPQLAPPAPTVVETPAGWRAATWRALLDGEPWVFAGFSCLAGALLLALAIVTGVGDSYGASNWGVTYIVLVPLIVNFQLKAMRRADATVAGLAAHGMLRTSTGGDPAAALRASMQRLGTRLVGFGAACAAASVPVSIAEWYHRYRDLPVPGTWWTESPVLGVVGAIAQGLLITAILVFVVHATAWTHVVHQLSLPRSQIRLQVDAGSADPRRGFEIFESPVLLTLVAGGLVQIALYLSNVQHIAEQQRASWYAVIVPSSARELLDTGTGRYPSSTTLLASLLVASFLIAAGYLLWRAGRDAGDAGGRLWPLPSLPPARGIALLVLAAACTLFFRLAPLGIAAGVAWVLLARRSRTS
jgi:tRNA A-37 threonylcarbamoyl transferase component Bud32